MKITGTLPSAPHTVYLCLGSNLGERQKLLEKARQCIEQVAGTVDRSSLLYETEAWGSSSEKRYLNQVLELKTSLQPAELLRQILSIEEELGRRRTGDRNADRFMDIDILFYDDLVVHEKELVIPHPRLQERRFVLIPLLEIAPDLLHPLSGKSVRRLLEECGDSLSVYPYGSGG